MRIGKQDQPFTSICTSDAESITVRGKDLCGEIIGKTNFTAYFWLLVTGTEPNEQQEFFANAVLCALAEHGLVPSVVAARMTYAAAPEALQGAVAAGLLGCGSVVLGSAEVAGRFYAECVADWRETGDDIHEVAVRNILALRQTTKAIRRRPARQFAAATGRRARRIGRSCGDDARVAGRTARNHRAQPARQRQRPDPRDHAGHRLPPRRAERHRPAVPHGGPDRPPDRGSGTPDRLHPERGGGGGDRV